MKRLMQILSHRQHLLTAIVALVAYAILYLVAAQLIIWVSDTTTANAIVVISPEWQQLLFRKRAPFSYEPIGVLTLGPIGFYLAVPNIVIALLLGTLVGLNAAVSYHSFNALPLRGAREVVSLLGTIPALMGGAACCVPTLVLIVGLQMSATVIAIWPLFVPASAALLLAALWWSLAHGPNHKTCT
jgi:hypothetical protein